MHHHGIETMKDKRTKLLVRNVIASFFIKGWAACVTLMMVPLTLKCLGVYQNGVWLTISSLLVWVEHMDIGLGNGLRNKLALHMAHQETEEARKVISSAMAMLICIVFPLLLTVLLIVWYSDIYALLNVQPDTIPEMRIALVCAVCLVCMTFVMKFIGNVYMGLQLPAVSNLLLSLGQTLALLFTALLYFGNHASFFNIVIANTAAPLIVYFLSYPYTFYHRFPELRPTLKYVHLKSAVELGNLSVKFFWLQIAGLIQFMTANILISRFFTPEMVTPYQIAYRYISIVMVIFTIICMPFWNATTDAYERKDIDWIRNAGQKINIIITGIGIMLILMVYISPWVYQVWIGDDCHVPMGMTIIMASYIFLLIISMRYSYFLNGIGALRLQLYMTVSAIIFIPLAQVVSSYTHDILWFMAVMCICNIPGLIVNVIQYYKIINNKANGIWEIR